MNIIYLDTLFFINCIIDYLMLLCTAKICSATLHRIQFAAASALGGIYACLCVIPQTVWLTYPAVKIAWAFLLCLISYGCETHFFRCTITFILVSAALGGIFSALSLSYDGVFYVPIDAKTIILTFAGLYFVLTCLFHRFPQTKMREFHDIEIVFREKKISFKALRDTGNELFDPVSNLPVLICEATILLPLFPATAVDNCQSDPLSFYIAANNFPGCSGKMRLIPFQSIGGHGFLVGFKPERLTIDGVESDLIVAISQQKFSTHNTHQAIY